MDNEHCQSAGTGVDEVDAFFIQVEIPDIKDYVVGLSMPFGAQITSLVVKSDVGTAVVSVVAGGERVPGLDNVVADTVRRTYLATGASVAAVGQDVALRVETSLNLLCLRASIAFIRD